MHPIYLQSVCQRADLELTGSRWLEIKEEDTRRLRLRFETDNGDSKTLCVELGPSPWLAGGTRRRSKDRMLSPQWAKAVRPFLGSLVLGVKRRVGDRVAAIELAGGARIQLELVPQAALICILDAAGGVRAHSALPKRARRRVLVGKPYQPPDPPPWPDPFDPRFLDTLEESKPAELQRTALERAGFRGALLNACLELKESAAEGFKALLARKLSAIAAGDEGPVLDVPQADQSASPTLWPWEPAAPPSEGVRRWTGTPTRVAAKYLEQLGVGETGEQRGRALRSLLVRERERYVNALRRAEGDRVQFEEPALYQRRGESLLAALHSATWEGENVRVTHVHDPAGEPLIFRAPPGRPLHEVAALQFEKMRRAERGIARADERIRELRNKISQVERWLSQVASLPVDFDELEAAMRQGGLPVGLAAPTRKGREWQAGGRVRLEGVRIVTSQDGFEILVGKSARENQRLTFRLAGPEDFWLHAFGVPGAHVVVRNPERLKQLPQGTLTEAAQLAAWFSEARDDTRVDVQYTRRKWVRKIRGGAPGAVQIKRFETVRVTPRAIGES